MLYKSTRMLYKSTRMLYKSTRSNALKVQQYMKKVKIYNITRGGERDLENNKPRCGKI